MEEDDIGPSSAEPISLDLKNRMIPPQLVLVVELNYS